MNKKIDYQQEILECLDENAAGMTVTDIANNLDIARNTVYRYLGELLGDGSVYKKKIGSYTLYYSKEKGILYKDSILSFFKGLLFNLKEIYPNQQQVFKLIGRNIADKMTLPITKEDRNFLKSFKNTNEEAILEEIGEIVPLFNILNDSISISKIEIKKDEKKAFITFVNSDLLGISDDHIYYFYLLAGLIEKKLSYYTDKEIRFEILEFVTYDKKEVSSIKIAFDFHVLLPEFEVEGIPESEIPDSDFIDTNLIKKDIDINILANIIHAVIFKKKNLILTQNDLIRTHLINFFTFIFKDSFDFTIESKLKTDYKKKTEENNEYLIFNQEEIIYDKSKFLKGKETKVERKIIQKAFDEIDSKRALAIFRIELQKAFKLAKELIKKINDISEISGPKKIDTKTIIDDLTNLYNVKISLSYLKFLIDIVESYIEVKIPELWKFFLVRL